MVAKAPIYRFDNVLVDAYGEIAMQNELISDAWSQFYKCIDLAGCTPTKLQVLLSSTISIEHQLQGMGGQSTSNAATNLQTYFGCAVPEHIEIHPPPTFITKGRGERMKTGVKRAVEL